jgi:hypothetical protein
MSTATASLRGAKARPCRRNGLAARKNACGVIEAAKPVADQRRD